MKINKLILGTSDDHLFFDGQRISNFHYAFDLKIFKARILFSDRYIQALVDLGKPFCKYSTSVSFKDEDVQRNPNIEKLLSTKPTDLIDITETQEARILQEGYAHLYQSESKEINRFVNVRYAKIIRFLESLGCKARTKKDDESVYLIGEDGEIAALIMPMRI